MPEREPPRSGAAGRTVRLRKHRRPARPAPAPTPAETDAVPPEVRAPNRIEWPGPLDEDERAALEAGWGFVE